MILVDGVVAAAAADAASAVDATDAAELDAADAIAAASDVQFLDVEFDSYKVPTWIRSVVRLGRPGALMGVQANLQLLA